MERELRSIAMLGYSILLIGFWGLGFAESWLAAGQWLMQAGLLWGYVCWCVRQRLALNRATASASLYSSLGWGNRLTILRGGLIAMAGGCLFQSQSAAAYLWIPAWSYTLAAILDRVDGYVARRSGQVSLLGNELDITFDALGLVVAPLLAIGYGRLHWSYLALSAAYYVYQWRLQCRSNLGLPVHESPPNPLRRTLAGFQMAFVAMALWPVLNPVLTSCVGLAFMLPVLFGFAVDWLVVTGRLPPQVLNTLELFSCGYFQPALRVLPALVLFDVLSDFGLSVSALGLSFAAGLILTGFAGRLGALVLIMLLGWQYPLGNAIDVGGYVLIFAASWILLLGTGRFSLWPWGDEWLKRYDGA